MPCPARRAGTGVGAGNLRADWYEQGTNRRHLHHQSKMDFAFKIILCLDKQADPSAAIDWAVEAKKKLSNTEFLSVLDEVWKGFLVFEKPPLRKKILVALRNCDKSTIEFLEKSLHERSVEKKESLRELLARRIEREHQIGKQNFVSLESAREKSRELKYEQKQREIDRKRWWLTVSTCLFEDLLNQLGAVPSEHVDSVLDRLTEMPATTFGANANRLWAFYDKYRMRLVTRPRMHEAHTVVEFAARLIIANRDQDARDLLEKLAPLVSRTLKALVDYLQFVLSKQPTFSETTLFSQLAEEDVFLASCYYGDGPARTALDTVSTWDWASVENHLWDRTSQEAELNLNSFKVKGLQPRIAELAFRRVRKMLYNRDTKEVLTDLNLQTVRQLPRPWSRHTMLPKADWRDSSSSQDYDVKCNLYFRSKKEKLGLRGLLLDLSGGSGNTYSGFIIVDSSAEECTWTYVGDYSPKSTDKLGRVLPFCFQIPVNARFSCRLPDSELGIGKQLLPDWKLKIGWCLANGRPPGFGFDSGASVEAHIMLGNMFDKVINPSEGTSLEYGLWKALTEITLSECFNRSKSEMLEFLELARKIVGCREFPVRLPRIGGDTLLHCWIREVLRPLCHYADRIRCPVCAGDRVRLEVTRMTAEGTILGILHCGACPPSSGKEVTILTHCQCGHYPLIIGKNPLCAICEGLVCDFPQGDSRCQQCKGECRGGKDTEESMFVMEPQS